MKKYTRVTINNITYDLANMTNDEIESFIKIIKNAPDTKCSWREEEYRNDGFSLSERSCHILPAIVASENTKLWNTIDIYTKYKLLTTFLSNNNFLFIVEKSNNYNDEEDIILNAKEDIILIELFEQYLKYLENKNEELESEIIHEIFKKCNLITCFKIKELCMKYQLENYNINNSKYLEKLLTNPKLTITGIIAISEEYNYDEILSIIDSPELIKSKLSSQHRIDILNKYSSSSNGDEILYLDTNIKNNKIIEMDCDSIFAILQIILPKPVYSNDLKIDTIEKITKKAIENNNLDILYILYNYNKIEYWDAAKYMLLNFKINMFFSFNYKIIYDYFYPSNTNKPYAIGIKPNTNNQYYRHQTYNQGHDNGINKYPSHNFK